MRTLLITNGTRAAMCAVLLLSEAEVAAQCSSQPHARSQASVLLKRARVTCESVRVSVLNQFIHRHALLAVHDGRVRAGCASCCASRSATSWRAGPRDAYCACNLSACIITPALRLDKLISQAHAPARAPRTAAQQHTHARVRHHSTGAFQRRRQRAAATRSRPRATARAGRRPDRWGRTWSQ